MSMGINVSIYIGVCLGQLLFTWTVEEMSKSGGREWRTLSHWEDSNPQAIYCKQVVQYYDLPKQPKLQRKCDDPKHPRTEKIMTNRWRPWPMPVPRARVIFASAKGSGGMLH